jgi:hypothetical protein
MYENRSLEIDFDDDLRSRLLDAVRAVNRAEAAGDVARNHNSPARCRGCGFALTARIHWRRSRPDAMLEC